MNIVDLSIKRPVLTIMALTALVIFGLQAYFSLPVILFPDMGGTIVTVQTVYAGASPQVIEAQVTKRIEDQVAAIGGVDSVTSYSMDSVSIVTVSFNGGKDENSAVQEVKDKIEVLLSDLPNGIQKPAVSRIDIASAMPVMQIVLDASGSGMDETELATYASTVVSEQLSQVSGVGSITVAGGTQREIGVELSRATVFERGIPVEQIAGIIASNNVELPGGSVEIENQNIPVRLKGEFNSLEEINDLDVSTSGGIFKLRQLAAVKDSHTEVKMRTILFDKKTNTRNDNAVLLSIVKNPSANTLDVVDGVMWKIPRIEAQSNGKISLKVIQEDASFVRAAIADTMGNVIMGIVLTGLVLFLFLHDIRSTLIVAIAMPFSIVSTFFIMKPLGISINVLSLMGLSCATGTLVANSVVVLENIFRYKALGLSRLEAAAKGTKEVIVAVFASTLTNVAVFVPLGTLEGGIGNILSSFALTIVISTIFSIIISFTLTPLMASRILPEGAQGAGAGGKIGKTLDAIFAAFEKLYAMQLAVMLKRKLHSGIVVILVFVLFVLSIMGFKYINFELMAQSDGGKIQVNVELPQGSDLNATASVLSKIEKRLAQYDEVESILTKLGASGSMSQDVSTAQMDIVLVAKNKRKLGNNIIASNMTKSLQDIPGAVIHVLPPSEIAISQAAPIDLYIRGEDSAVLQEIGEKLKNTAEKVPGIMNTALNSKAGKQELIFEPKRKRLSEDGLTVQNIAVALRAAIDGLVLTSYKEEGEEYDIRVKIANSDLLSIDDIRNIPVVTHNGTNPLIYYADVKFYTGYNMIMRFNKYRTVEFTAELLPGYSQFASLGAVTKAANEIELPEGYTISQAGASEAMGESMLDMAMVFIIAILLVYMLLAAVLESFSQAVFILATVPLSLIGVIVACIITRTVLNVVAMLGIIMLVGIVVNNAILILDYYNQLRIEGGYAVREALIASCSAKLKAILMSNIAIVLGLVPMASGFGASMAEIRQPMGIVIIGGIISAMFLTLYLIPAMEFVLSKKNKNEKNKGERK